MATKYMERKFKDDFAEVMEMWTSEDGMLMSLVVARVPDAELMIREHHVFQSPYERFDRERIRERFVERARLEGDGRGVVWVSTDIPTDFPVYEYELEIPR